MRAVNSFIAVLLFSTLFASGVYAEYDPFDSSTHPFRNAGGQNYLMAGDEVYSYLIDDGSSYIRVEAVENYKEELIESGEGFNRYSLTYFISKLIVEVYNRDFNLLSTREIPCELDKFGGFYSGKEFNYFVFGQDNYEEDDTKEVIRVVKYDKDWNRLDSVSLFGGDNKIPTDIGSDTQIPLYTYAPFDSGSLRMAEYGDMLYIMTAHTNYNSPSGIHHQSSMILAVNTSDMRITDAGEPASHSFNQFILISGDKLVTLDHGDGNPRAFGMSMWNAPAGSEFIREGNIDVNIMEFAGASGENKTSASVGGLEVSDTSYLTAGNSIDQSSPIYDQLETRNIFVSATPIDNFTESETKIKWLTAYEENGETTTSTPHLVKIDGDRFLVMWTEGEDEDEQILYVEVNGQGDFQTPVNYMKGHLSDCKPILSDGSIVWYVTDNFLLKPTFYGIKTDDITQTWSVATKSESGPVFAFPYKFTSEDMYGNTVTNETLGEKELFFIYYLGIPYYIFNFNGTLTFDEEKSLREITNENNLRELAALTEKYGDRIGIIGLSSILKNYQKETVNFVQNAGDIFKQNPGIFPIVDFEAPGFSELRKELYQQNGHPLDEQSLYNYPEYLVMWMVIDREGNIYRDQFNTFLDEWGILLERLLDLNANPN